MQFQEICTNSFCIYGAGIVATGVYAAIKTLYHKVPLFFLVSDFEKNDENHIEASKQLSAEIDSIAVKSLSVWKRELQAGTSDCTLPKYYLIAAPQVHHSAIIASLHSVDTVQIEESQIIQFTSELENELMEAYYSSLPGHTTILSLMAKWQMQENSEENYSWENCPDIYTENIGSKIPKIQIYQAKSHMDKPLSGQHTGNAQSLYIYPIQVGAALTDQMLTDLRDNQGDNISAKNRNYCELTATYYAWKHSHAEYKGICHYRRIFDISDEQMQRLLEMKQEWDVILPYPSVHFPNISAQHARYVKDVDWNAMLWALEEVAPEYLDAYEKSVTSGEQFFHNFNMLIAKAPVFDDYCDFLFRVLERTEELTTPKGWERADRFAGYLGENLTTIYFLKNRDKWKIAYAGKIWLT